MEFFIRTVSGDIAIEKINKVLIHEHVIWNINKPKNNLVNNQINIINRWQTNYDSNLNYDNLIQEDIETATEEIKKIILFEGDLIVDQSTYGIGRNVNSLLEISKNAKMNIVAGAGTYCCDYIKDEIKSLSIDELIQRFTNEINTGINNTNIKAGIIGEIGCSYPLEQFEKKALIAAAETSKLTGAAISIHPGKNPDSPFELIDIVKKTGADISKVAICHIDRTFPSGNRIIDLLNKGVYIEWDLFGIENSNFWLEDIELPMDRDRIKLIKKFFDLGFGNKILISQDICTKTRLNKWGGHGYSHIFKNVLPLMLKYGMNNNQIELLIKMNPINFLSMRK